MRIYTLIFIASLVIPSVFVHAQLSPETLEKYKKAHPNSDGIVLSSNKHYQLEYDKRSNKLRTYYSSSEKRAFLNEKAPQYAEGSVYFSHGSPLKNIEAFVISSVEGKKKKYKVKNFDTTNAYSSSIFYDDGKQIEFIYTGLAPGSIKELNYKRERKDIHFFGSARMGSVFPLEKGVISVTYPNFVTVEYTAFHLDSFDVSFTKTIGKKETTLRWEFSKMPKFKYRNENIDFAKVYPTLIFRVNEYKPKKAPLVKVLGDTNALYAWYYSLIEKPQKGHHDGLEELVDSLTKGVDTKLEKAKIVYNWVQHNIDYIALEYGKGGIIPREPNLVYERRYGDCKDMSCLLKKMLEYADVPANLAWVGTRDIPYSYRDVSSPLVDNHMICVYIENDSVYYMDATSKYNKFGAPTSFIQQKSTLIERGPDQYLIYPIRTETAMDNVWIDSCQLDVKNTDIIGSCQATFSGYIANGVRRNLESNKGDSRLKYLERLLEKGSNRYLIKDFRIINELDNNSDISIQYNFEIQNMVQSIGDEIYVKPSMHEFLKNDEFTPGEYLYGYEMDFAYFNREVNVLRAPEGYHISHVPNSNKAEHKDYSYSISYQQKNQKELVIDHKVEQNLLYFHPDAYGYWNDLVSKAVRDYNNAIILKKDE